jgi:RNA polymerase sigma-70 factor, ECF subfamily
VGGPLTENSTIDDLLARYQEADAAAFDEFFKLTQQSVYGYFLSKFRSREDADEGFQETYLRIHKYVMSYDRSKNGQTWVFSIARNVFIDILKKRRLNLPLEDVEEVAATGTSNDSLHLIIVRRQLESLLHPLSAEEYNLLESRLLEDRSFEDISEAMKVSPANLRQRYSRLIRRLKESK